MSKHTPGSWFVSQGQNGAFSIDTTLPDGCSAAIASRGRWDHRAEQSIANARLIAAAPDLLASLTELVDRDQWDRDNGRQSYQNGSPVYDMWEDARAAIAKATQ